MALPYDALFRHELRQAAEKGNKPEPDEIRSREQAFYARNAAAQAKEAGQ